MGRERTRGIAARVLPLLFVGWTAGAAGQTPLFVPDDPPRASLIELSAPSAAGEVTVTGLPGSVPADASVILVNLEAGHAAETRAAGDGSFAASLFAPAGTSILVKADITRTVFQRLLDRSGGFLFLGSSPSLSPLPGTIVRVPDPAPAGPGIPFGNAGLVRFTSPPDSPLPAWTFQGQINTQSLATGDTLRVQGVLRISSPVVAGAGVMRAHTSLTLDQVTGPDGTGSLSHATLGSTILTPTGLPIERGKRHHNRHLDAVSVFTLGKVAADRAEAVVDMSLVIPADLPSGFYSPRVTFFQFEGVPTETPPARLVLTVGRAQRRETSDARLPIVHVGAPASPRVFWTLLTDTLSNGARGLTAVEDRARFGVASRIVTQSDTFVVPRHDPATGQPLGYRLEPFLLAVSVANEAPPHPPLIPFRLPSGSLIARVRKPDGSVDVIGPAPFLQARVKSLADRDGTNLDTGGGHITDAYQLSTMDSRFEVQFTQDGLHVITLEGAIEDIWGNTWTGGGTYEVHVARLLSLDTAVLPGMPFEVGDVFSAGLLLSPPVPAEVEVRLRLAPDSDATRTAERRVKATANRFGYFHPVAGGVQLDQPGEYRVDVTASFRDEQGVLWMGARTWGGVVAPRNPDILAHGRRGIDSGTTIGPQWFFRSQTGISAFIPGASHVFFPFHSGDVQWMEKTDSTFPLVTIQDPGGALAAPLRERASSGQSQDVLINLVPPGTFDERTAAGEVPLFSSRPDFRDPHYDPSGIDLWAYSYRSVQRPLVRVREEIGEETMQASPYWRFSDQYARQIGVGANGDLPNEIKFQYGAAVIRGAAVGAPRYAIYGSLFVLVPDSQPPGQSTRVFPPFQGNGGGPSGGPIMTLKGRDIDLFLHLTGVRPGTVLEVGDVFSLSGAVGPPLSGLVTYTVTKPDGQQRGFAGRANRVGYYYRPEHDVLVDQPGLWTVDLTVSYDGTTSAGQVAQPFPAGDILGTSAGRFLVFAVPRGSPLLGVSLPRSASLAAPVQLDVPISLPAGVTPERVVATAMMPGFMLETRDLPVGGPLGYRFDSVVLAGDFPNLDVSAAGRPDAADLITLAVFATGRRPDGSSVFAARVLALHGPELLNLGVQQRAPSFMTAAVLPSSRSVHVGTAATAFATIINSATTPALGVAIAPPTGFPASFTFQTTDPATNAVTGTPDTPVDIPAGGSQSFVIALGPTTPVEPVDVGFAFTAANLSPADPLLGINTLAFTASPSPVPDIVALAATLSGDGVVNIPGAGATGAFSVATSNLGAAAMITAAPDTGGAGLPVVVSICETNPVTGACLGPVGPSATTLIGSGATPTFAIFVESSGPAPFDPAANRIHVRFRDPTGVLRGATSVAVRTQ